MTNYDQLVAKCRENLRSNRPLLEGLSKSEATALMTRYSKFQDTLDEQGMLVASEVVLRALRPPRPFLHLMASNHDRLRGSWGSFWDGTQGGFCCLDSVLAGRMSSHLDTNYVPTCPEPQDVRRFWVHEGGKSWPMFPVPGYEENSYHGYQCRMGLDEYSVTARRGGLEASLVVHVPADWALEVWQVTLTNNTDKPRKLVWFAHLRVNVDSFPFYYFVPRVVCEGLLEDGAMVFLNHDQNNKHPRQAFLVSQPQFDGYDMMSEVFDGWSPRAVIPAAVRGTGFQPVLSPPTQAIAQVENLCHPGCFNSPGLQPAAGLVAAAQFNAQLAAGESKTWTIIYGACSADAVQRKELIARVRRELLGQAEKSRQDVAEVWRQKVLADAIATPSREINRYFNVWSKYQARNQSRFCHALDKIGYRDILQHLWGICDFDAPYVRARLAEALAFQYPDGRAVRQYELFAGSGLDQRMYQDSPVWIPDTLIKYVKETGDFAFLDEQVAYLDAQTLGPSQSQSGSVYEHAARGLSSITGNTGFHGLCKIGYGDWNDALSRIGGEKGVSVWLSCAAVHACRQMAALAEATGKGDDAGNFRKVADDLTARINQHAWDGQWYIYAINRDGLPLGSASQKEGRIHLNVNTWAIFSGVAASAGRQEQVWQALEALRTPIGHVLLAPPYSRESGKDVGRIADIMPGQFENGSVYMHGESFYLYALVTAGRSDQWLAEVFNSIPSCLVPDITTGPPHQQSNYAAGPAHAAFGTNPFSNFTGSLAWYRRGIEAVVGVLADFGGLRIAPRAPRAWKGYRVVKNFRSCRVEVDLKRGRKLSVKLDGQEVGAFLPAEMLRPGSVAKVEVVYT